MVVVWHDLICLCDKILRMSDDMHIVVNVYIMHVFVNGLLYGLECEHVSIVDCC